MVRMICFDMDGTIADLYNVPNWLYRLRSNDPTPYLEARPLWDIAQLVSILNALTAEGWEIRVISWLSKDSTEEYKSAVRKAKREWLNRYSFPCSHCHLIQYGTTKADCVRKCTDKAILIDDSPSVRKGWHLGETIDPTTENLIEVLSKLLERK